MSGVGSQFFTDLQKLSATHLNAGGRHTGNALQLLLGFLAFDDSGAVSSTGRMLGGLTATITGGTLNMVMTQGGAAFKHANPAGLSAVIDTFESIPTTVVAVVDGTTLAFTANASGDTRIDYIVVDWSLFTDRNISMPQKTGGPVLQDTRHAVRGVLSILQGTPAAGDPVPTATQQALYRIEIPDGTNAANFDTNAIIKELSQNVTFDGLGPGHGPYQRRGYPDTEEISLIQASARGEGQAIIRWRWDDDAAPDKNIDHWFTFRRLVVPAGEATADLFPLVNPGGREWSRVFGLGTMVLSGEETPGDTVSAQIGFSFADGRYVGTNIRHLTANADTGYLSQALIGDVRGLQIIAARLGYNVATPLASGNHQAQLWLHDASSPGAAVTVSDNVTMPNGAGAQLLTLTGITANLVLETDDFLFIVITVNHPASGDVAFYTMTGLSLDLREGRQ